MTRHHRKKSFLSYIWNRMINGSSSAKNIREATIYGNAQGEMINGSSSAKNIREATIYGKYEGMVRTVGFTTGWNPPSCI
ncbi:unnamed protein product [Rhizophagus irregularis]|uniref:Uncharacterized protein n=1 Tax=Rhizophagus irregularis TaxID=588596 RepID=A0A915Z2Z5_9GLOM|nr:unnamed protein product [Rhizophagus irregularis]